MNKKQLVISAVLLSAACAPKVDNRGYISESAFKERVIPGQTSKSEVLENFGSPSSQSSFGPETWYYISSQKETVAFFRPEVTEQQITRIEFDSGGVVSKLEALDKSAAKDFPIAKRTTPTEGHQLSFIEQTLGNIGRFNKSGDSGSTVAPGRKTGGRY